MIEIEQATCERCGRPIEIKEIGPNKRKYCDNKNACKQAAFRLREKERKIEAAHDTALTERIAELEAELAMARKLEKMWEEKYYQGAAYHNDVRNRHFKFWLRNRPKPNDTDFFKRFLADRRINESASRSMYEARLRLNGYSEEDIALFQAAWIDMLYFKGEQS